MKSFSSSLSVGTHTISFEVEDDSGLSSEIVSRIIVVKAEARVEFVGMWGSEGNGDGEFLNPDSIGAALEMAYVLDRELKSIQIFQRTQTTADYQGRLLSDTKATALDVSLFGDVYVLDRQWVTLCPRKGPKSIINLDQDANSIEIAVDVDEFGNNMGIWVIDIHHKVQRYSLDGQLLVEWGSLGAGDGEFRQPRGIAVDNDPSRVYVADTENNRVQVFSPDGTFIKKWGMPGVYDGQFNRPVDIAVDNNGIVYVVDCGNDRVQIFSPDGEFLGKWGTIGNDEGEFMSPSGIAIDPHHHYSYIYVLDSGNYRVQVFKAYVTP
jgi:hypothetical protein